MQREQSRIPVVIAAVVLVVAIVLCAVFIVIPALTGSGSADSGQKAEEFGAVTEQGGKEPLPEGAVNGLVLTKGDNIMVDGEPLTLEQAIRIGNNSQDYNADIEYLPQNDHLVSGCEIIALAVALRAEGYDVLPKTIADNYLFSGPNLATDYRGSPSVYNGGGGFPPCIVDAANGYLDANGGGATAYDLTGTTFDGLLALVKCGYPIVTWTTESMTTPWKTGLANNGVEWYAPEHCVTVYGVEGEDVLVSDSLAGLVHRDLEDFADIYEECGNRCLIVQKD